MRCPGSLTRCSQLGQLCQRSQRLQSDSWQAMGHLSSPLTGLSSSCRSNRLPHVDVSGRSPKRANVRRQDFWRSGLWNSHPTWAASVTPGKSEATSDSRGRERLQFWMGELEKSEPIYRTSASLPPCQSDMSSGDGLQVILDQRGPRPNAECC